MIGTLIESQAHVQRHSLESAVSVVVHAALVIAAVVATSTRSAARVRPVEYFPMPMAVPRPPARDDANPSRTAQTSVRAVPQIPTIHVPAVIPMESPPVDLLSVPTALDFSERRSHGDPPCAAPCPQPALGEEIASPSWAMNEVMMQLREPAVPPRYPEALQRAGIDGAVVVRFVVDTLGRVDPASIEVLTSSHDLFTAAVRETLARLRFIPAKSDDRKVRMRAIMPFHFTLK
jgi:periplasmic protein TonB